ncbi:putative mitochondrial protein AtMg00310 [Apium graveolens]|uniref:putative mitochondrial protein AtMg00310 n=1 Tax=Apium graveolens TaxID=4045 RepID=UPI003D79693D
MVNMLQIFEHASGQKINVDKSSAFFNRNTQQHERVNICKILRVGEAEDNSTYLGLPNMLGRKKTSIFGYLKDHLRDRVQGWDKKYLSGGGKEILLKTVAQSLPNYAMGIFLIPQQICKELEGIMSKFWWRTSKQKERGISWLSWDRLCKRKTQGGLGFRKLHEFNIALLGKQIWRFLTNRDSLVSRLYKARYFPNSSFLEATLGNNSSYTWKSILEAQVLLKKGAVRRIGSGETVSIENDPWLPHKEDPYIHTSHEALKILRLIL